MLSFSTPSDVLGFYLVYQLVVLKMLPCKIIPHLSVCVIITDVYKIVIAYLLVNIFRQQYLSSFTDVFVLKAVVAFTGIGHPKHTRTKSQYGDDGCGYKLSLIHI